MISSFCVIGISGYSGSGKTTLIEKIVQGLKKEGLYIGLLKHASRHGLSVDGEGKDSERFYRAGADFVFVHDPEQGFARFPLKDAGLFDALAGFPKGLDVVLVEGHKSAEIPGIWIQPGKRTEKHEIPAGVSRKVIYRDDPKYVENVMAHIHREIRSFHSDRTLTAGLLVGGRSRRMGTSKAMLKIRDETLLERSLKTLGKIAARTIFLGSAELPVHLHGADRLTDAAGVEGPMAGILSAFRWAPESTWIISAVDMPFMDKEAWEWVLGQRRPGVWAVLPLLKSGAKAETMAACYEPMIFDEVEALARNGIRTLQKLAAHPKVITPLVPQSLIHAWKNVNTSEEWNEACALIEDLSAGGCAE